MTEFSRAQIEARLAGLDVEPSSPEVVRLQRRLEGMVDGVMTIRRTLRPAAERLSRRPPKDQERFIDAADFVAATSLELAYNFCTFAIPVFERMDPAAWPAWVLRILDIYDAGGTLAAITAMKEAAEAGTLAQMRPGAVELSEVVRVLEGMLHGLEGRRLRIEADDPPWTDTDVVYLPPVLARAGDREGNFRLYKAMAVHLWAQVRYGTWSVDLASVLPEGDRALTLFYRLETERLDACIARDLPGVGRVLEALARQEADPLPGDWRARLRRPEASVADSLALAVEALGRGLTLTPQGYQGVLRPGEVKRTRARRIHREKTLFRKWLRHLLEQEGLRAGRIAVRRAESGPGDALQVPEITIDAAPVAMPPEFRALTQSIMLDLGEIPPEYLVPAGPGAWSPAQASGAQAREAAPGEAPFVYDEWDHQRQRYRKAWCRVREQPLPAADEGFALETLRRHRPLLLRLHHGFEALREAPRRMRRQVQGDEVDLDALIEAWVDLRRGQELDERLFVETHKRERDVAVAFLVDVSGSTDGWVNRVEREALVLLCEALERLGDRYAIYGFSGFTHRRCELYPVKRFDEPYDATVRGRIGALRPRDYTRMGAAIRHLTGVLGTVEARTRLLVALTDGRPDDQDGYRGPYGIEDTRKALLEARAAGIHPFCITLDTEALDYLPHMYGPTGFTVVDRIERLPFKVADIYRRLTCG